MNKIITEIDLIRPFLIILVVLYHSFIIFAGGWQPVVGYVDIPVYKYISVVSYSFMLEGFVLISGYIYGYQLAEKGIGSFTKLLSKKFLRLLVPAIIWSLIYSLSLFDGQINIITILSGAGHLWFLIMLFWVFIGCFLIYKFRINYCFVWLLLLISALLSSNPLPLQLNAAMYYIFFFYLGTRMYVWMSDRKSWFAKCSNMQILAGWGGYLLIMTLGILLSQNTSDYTPQTLNDKLVFYALLKITMLLKTVPAMFGLLWLGKRLSRIIAPNPLYLRLGHYGMGIYIFQQFILQLLYYHTSISSVISVYLLPWIGFFVAMMVSYYMTHLMISTKIGCLFLGDRKFVKQ